MQAHYSYIQDYGPVCSYNVAFIRVADVILTSDVQQGCYTNFDTAAWILVQLLTSTTPVHNINT